MYIDHFDSPEQLASEESLCILLCLGLILHLENCKVECLNALLRRLQRAHSVTHVADIEETSAEFMIRQEAVSEKKFRDATQQEYNKVGT